MVLLLVAAGCSGGEPTALRAAVDAFADDSGGFGGGLDEDCLTARLARFDDSTLESAIRTSAGSDFENLPPSVAPVFAAAASCATESSSRLVETVVDAFVEAAVARHPDRECVTRAVETLDPADLQAAASGMLDLGASDDLADRLAACLES